MVRFEELQSLWQRQPARGVSPQQASALSTAFRRYGKRNDLIYYAKLVVLAAQFIFLVSQLRHRPLALFGACLADLGAIQFLIHDWRTQRAIAQLNFADPSTKFLRKAIARLNARRNPFRNRQFSIAMGGFAAGLTVMLASDWPRLTVMERVLRPPMIATFPFLAYGLGRWIRGKRFRSECLPLIERLTAMLRIIEGGRT